VGFGLVTGFIGHFQHLIAVYYGAICNSHIPQFTTTRTEYFQSALHTSPLVPFSRGGRFLSSRFPNCLRATATATLDSQCFQLKLDPIVTKLNSMAWVRDRTIPTERPTLVGEVIANFLRIGDATWSAWRIPTAVFSVFWTWAASFLSSSSSVVIMRQSGPRSRPTTFSGSAWNRTRASGSEAKTQ
jgi:hypothetical protein